MSAVGLLLVLAGALMVYAGITGQRIRDQLAAILRGGRP